MSFDLIYDPRRLTAYTFNHLTFTPVIFQPVIAVPRPLSTHPQRLKWMKVDTPSHPPATNASLAPLRIENSGATSLPCIQPKATSEAAYPVIVLHCSAFVLILGLDTHKRTIPQRTVRLSCVCKSADGAEKSSDGELTFLPPIRNEFCQANILVVFERMGGCFLVGNEWVRCRWRRCGRWLKRDGQEEGGG